MTRKEIINGLKMSMDLTLFDPSTGEVMEPWQLNEVNRTAYEAYKGAIELLEEMPSAQPNTTTHDPIPAETGENDGDGTSGDCISRQSEQSACEYCHEDSDGYVLSVEKNGHAYIQNGKLALRANGWWGECAINYCPMCGRKLRGDKHETD